MLVFAIFQAVINVSGQKVHPYLFNAFPNFYWHPIWPNCFTFFYSSQCVLHFSTDTIYLFFYHLCFLCPRLSVIFLVHQFLKVLLPSFKYCLRIYHHIVVFILQNPHLLYILLCSVSLPSQSVQLLLTFFCFQSSIQIVIRTSLRHRNLNG